MFLKRATNCLLFLTLIYLPHTDAESIRAVEGATVYLPCHSLPDDFEKVSVEWINRTTNTTICEWSFNKKIGSYARHCSPRFTFNRTSLRIENVNLSDSARPGLSLQKQNSSNDSCILLLCSLEGLNPELVNFTWIREGQGSIYSSTSYNMNSSLRLCKPDWSDGDTIICRANYSNTQTQKSIRLASRYPSDKASRQDFPAVCVAFFSIFIIAIIFI